jgi:hypothetical protein
MCDWKNWRIAAKPNTRIRIGLMKESCCSEIDVDERKMEEKQNRRDQVDYAKHHKGKLRAPASDKFCSHV